MRFTTKFSRFKGVPGPVLGSDAAPTTAPNPSINDNCLIGKFCNINGYPAHRIAVVYKYIGVGVPLALPATMVFWEDQIGAWFQIGGSENLVDGEVTFFDVVGILDQANTSQGLDTPTSGSIAQLLLVTDPGGAPVGEHVFAIAPDLTVRP